MIPGLLRTIPHCRCTTSDRASPGLGAYLPCLRWGVGRSRAGEASGGRRGGVEVPPLPRLRGTMASSKLICMDLVPECGGVAEMLVKGPQQTGLIEGMDWGLVVRPIVVCGARQRRAQCDRLYRMKPHEDVKESRQTVPPPSCPSVIPPSSRCSCFAAHPARPSLSAQSHLHSPPGLTSMALPVWLSQYADTISSMGTTNRFPEGPNVLIGGALTGESPPPPPPPSSRLLTLPRTNPGREARSRSLANWSWPLSVRTSCR